MAVVAGVVLLVVGALGVLLAFPPRRAPRWWRRVGRPLRKRLWPERYGRWPRR